MDKQPAIAVKPAVVCSETGLGLGLETGQRERLGRWALFLEGRNLGGKPQKAGMGNSPSRNHARESSAVFADLLTLCMKVQVLLGVSRM